MGITPPPVAAATRQRLPPFGPATAVCLLLGALAAVRLPELPPAWLWFGLLLAGVAAWVGGRGALRALGALLFGAGWLLCAAQQGMQARLPVELAGQDLRIEGRVLGLPERGERQQRFLFEIESGEGEAASLAGRRLRLSWFDPAPTVAPGQRWALELRLRRPRGTQNPGGYDFERRALEQRIAATGYVRRALQPEPLAAAGGLDAWRERQSQALADAVPAPGARFVRALALGDTRGLEARDWEVLRATGLTHLLAISGYHIGVVAGFAALLAGLFYRAWPGLGLRLPRPQGAALLALAGALGYAAAAGFTLPVLRALLMVAVALSARLLRRANSTAQSLALALLALLLADPLALLAPGFWLSFLGVAWLLWCLPRGDAAPAWRVLLTAQGVAAIGLLPLTVWFFGQASVLGPLVNLVGIPLISLAVVPLSLLALAGGALGLPGADLAGRLGAWIMDLSWPWLERIADLDGALVWLPEPDALALLLALLGGFWLLLPRGVPGRALGLLLFLPLLLPARERLAPGGFELQVLDVGQGLAVLVRTADHALLYDAGPAFPGGLDAGEAMVAPALRALGVTRLDALVISHGDNDHAGGAESVRRAFPPARAFAPNGWQPERHRTCEAGLAWDWDGVRFAVLHPTPHFPYLGNDSSCVLRIEGAHGSALLPGDIGEVVERRLLRDARAALDADWLVVAHHGSRSSSSPDFIEAVTPRAALVSAGHDNRFGHPHPEVIERLRARGIQALDTGALGAIRVVLDGSGQVAWRRQSQRRLWHEPLR